MEDANAYRWFAVQVKGRQARLVAAHLESKGFETLLPLYAPPLGLPGRRKALLLSLFPGYLFCRFDPARRLPLLTTPGVIAIVGIGNQPVPFDAADIAAIRAVTGSGLPLQRCAFMTGADWVRVKSGPLRGLRGLFTSIQNREHLIVPVELIQRSIAVEIGDAGVEPIEDHAGLLSAPGCGGDCSTGI